MFSRRDTQHVVATLTGSLTGKQLAELVGRLNHQGDVRISAAWEAVVLASVAANAALAHEVDRGTRPDIDAVFTDPDIRIVADVGTASGSDMEDENPVNRLWESIVAASRTLGMDGNGFTLSIGRREATVATQRRLLALPLPGDLERLMRDEIGPFLQEVANSPHDAHRWKYDRDDVDLELAYSPRQRVSITRMPTYTWPRTIRHNPLFRMLEAKAKQLRKAKVDACKGILVCDGGCEAFNSDEQIVRAFFAQHRTTVSFVALLEVPDERIEVDGRRRLRVTSKLFWNPHHSDANRSPVERALSTIVDAMPRPRLPSSAA